MTTVEGNQAMSQWWSVVKVKEVVALECWSTGVRTMKDTHKNTAHCAEVSCNKINDQLQGLVLYTLAAQSRYE